jgi:hypothetical protein
MNIVYYLKKIFFSWWDWGSNSGLHVGKVGALPLEPNLQSIRDIL